MGFLKNYPRFVFYSKLKKSKKQRNLLFRGREIIIFLCMYKFEGIYKIEMIKENNTIKQAKGAKETPSALLPDGHSRSLLCEVI